MEINIKDGYKVTEVGVIPDDWEEVLLDSVAKRGSGHTPNKRHSEYWKGDIKWISLKDSNRFDNIYIYDTNEKITLAGIANSSAVLHPSESVILSRDAGVGKSAITKDVMAVSQHFFAWQCSLKLNNHFLYYWLQSQKPEFERIANGTTIKTIGIAYFQKYKIPLPPLAEQKAIAHALSDVDNLITAIDQLITKKRNIKQGTMQQLLTGKKRLPGFSGEWEVKKLGDIGKFKNGINKGKKDFGFGYPFVNLLDIFGQAKLSNNSSLGLVNSNQKERNDYDLRKGDILFVRSSVKPEGVGLTSVILEDLNNSVYSGFLIRFRNLDLLDLDLGYKQYCFYEESFRKKIIDSSTVSANTNINQDALKNLEIKLPPTIEEQKAISEILNDIDKEIEALEKKRDKYKALKQGMMQELLTGKTRIIDN